MSVFHGIGIFLLSFSISMALGIFFGLFMSLTLKHSALNQFPQIESCLVALCAYTCYFFSNGLSMSGIVSLLFCGITLKHYAYHTMSRRTQRATKYLFSVLAQLSENFIFVYLGLSLFTSPPSESKLTSYFKPLFIIVTTVSVIFVRYAAVFPLSELINLFQRHVRGQRTDEIPYAYQMMLFWAGLRGAVGVALAAGFRTDNAQVLRTTVLVVVVLTVVLFGGTTARMLELLGIRTGVEDDTISSDEEEAAVLRNGWYGSARRGGSGLLGRYSDEADRFPRPTRNGPRSQAHLYNHHDQHTQNQGADIDPSNIFSASSSDSYDSDNGEVLPLATPTHVESRTGASTPNNGARTPQIGEEGKWFQTLDERYFLPLFSNATASRSFHARRVRRTSGVPAGSAEGSINATPAESEDEGGQELDLRTLSARSRGVASPAPWTPRPQVQHGASSSSSDANGSGYDRRMGSPALRSPQPTPDSKFNL